MPRKKVVKSDLPAVSPSDESDTSEVLTGRYSLRDRRRLSTPLRHVPGEMTPKSTTKATPTTEPRLTKRRKSSLKENNNIPTTPPATSKPRPSRRTKESIGHITSPYMTRRKRGGAKVIPLEAIEESVNELINDNREEEVLVNTGSEEEEVHVNTGSEEEEVLVNAGSEEEEVLVNTGSEKEEVLINTGSEEEEGSEEECESLKDDSREEEVEKNEEEKGNDKVITTEEEEEEEVPIEFHQTVQANESTDDREVEKEENETELSFYANNIKTPTNVHLVDNGHRLVVRGNDEERELKRKLSLELEHFRKRARLNERNLERFPEEDLKSALTMALSVSNKQKERSLACKRFKKGMKLKEKRRTPLTLNSVVKKGQKVKVHLNNSTFDRQQPSMDSARQFLHDRLYKNDQYKRGPGLYVISRRRKVV